MALKILEVGQCGFDGPRMKQLFEEELDATVVTADTADDAVAAFDGGDFDLVLVNRLFAADGGSGIDLIKQLAREDGPPLMLVSDKPDAQEQAVAAGAVQGFGKAELDAPATLDLIRKAAGEVRS